MKNSAIDIFVNITVPDSGRYGGKTGSLVRMVEMFKKFKELNKNTRFIFNVTEGEARYFQENNLEAEYRILKSSLKFKNFISLCLEAFFLTVKALLIFGVPRPKESEEKMAVYASSDLFWEVIPAFVYKLRNKQIEWVQIIHHIYPDWKKRLGNPVVNFFGYYFQRFSLYLIRKKADKIIVMNKLVKNSLLKKRFNENSIYVLSNGIDPDYFSSIKKSDNSYDGIYLGRLDYTKGVEDLINIWEKICRKIPEARLAIIGGSNWKIKKELVEKVKAEGLGNNIEILGFLENDKAFSILKASKVFLFPSHEEGWGIVIAEAMTCGLPVVSWDLPVYREVFENHTAQIKENDSELFSAKVVEILKDDSLRERIGRDGKEFVKKYSWDAVAKKELEIIHS